MGSIARLEATARHFVCLLAALELTACSESRQRGGPDTNEDCAGRRCAVTANCDVSPDAQCRCNPGYEGDGESCRDVDECAADAAACSPLETCLNRAGSFSCECLRGYERDASGACVDIDECQGGPCDALVQCQNEPASFSCGVCPDEHWGNGVGAAGCTAKVLSGAVGGFHSCVIRVDGAVKCWGGNMVGELGLGDTKSRGANGGELGDALHLVELGAGRKALALTAGSLHTCARLDDESVKCWGSNEDGRLGLGDTMPRGDDPDEMGDRLGSAALGQDALVVAIAAGDAHTCALLRGGSVKCWGANTKGQLGLGDTTSRGSSTDSLGDALPAVALGSGLRAEAIAAGGANACALLDDGSLKCWGDNQSGQLGTGDTDARGDGPDEMGDALTPISLGAGRHAVSVAVGALGFACALLDDGALKCWGSNDFGQLGLGDTEARGDQPAEMGDALPAVNLGTDLRALEVALGGAHSCAMTSDANAKCWGINQYATLGLGDFDDRGDSVDDVGEALPSISLGTGRHVTAILPGRANHTCAILDRGEIKCWGSNGLGQLGYGDIVSRGGRPGEMGDALPSVILGHLN
jgi:alpha-tubulin suppressor-like RCC1 family protein